jgi:transposase
MRALDPEVKEAVWLAVEPLVPIPVDTHPLGRHRRRKSDKDAFEVILVRLVTGCSWEDAERLCGNKMSDTTVRSRRDEWERAGVFDTIANEALRGYDKVIGLRLGAGRFASPRLCHDRRRPRGDARPALQAFLTAGP